MFKKRSIFSLILILVFVLSFTLPGLALTSLEYTANNSPSRNVDVGVNVVWFGAVPDDDIDDSAAIQNAINYGKPVFIPRGVFIAQNLTLPSNTVIYSNEGGTFKLPSGVAANTKLLKNSNQTITGNSNIRVYGLNFDGNRAGNAATVGLTAIEFKYVTGSEVSDCSITGFTQHGIDNSYNCSYNKFSNNIIKDFGLGEVGFGIVLLSGSNYNTLENNTIITSLQNTCIGIDDGSGVPGVGNPYAPSTFNTVSGNYTEGGLYSIAIEGACVDNTIVGNTVYNATKSIAITEGSQVGLAQSNNITSNTIRPAVDGTGITITGRGQNISGNIIQTPGIGIKIPDANALVDPISNISITNNHILDATLTSIDIGQLAYSQISGNIIKNGSTTGIQIISEFAAVTGITVSNNVISNAGGNGIFIAANTGNAVDDVLISGNVIQNCALVIATADAIQIMNNGSIPQRVLVVNNVITDNQGVKTTRYGINLVGVTSGVRYIGNYIAGMLTASLNGIPALALTNASGQFTTEIIATASLPIAGVAQDGRIIVEDAGAGDRNIIIYAGGQRFRLDGGVPF